MVRTNLHSEQERIADNVATAFNEAQRTTAVHPRAIKLLLSAQKRSPEYFAAEFFLALNRILPIFAREPRVERLVEFIAHFALTDAKSSGNIATLILQHLVGTDELDGYTMAKDPAIRFRSVQLIAKVLHTLPQDAELPDNLLDEAQNAIFDASKDRVPRVRAAAAAALCRMQQDHDSLEDDPCTARLAEMLHDSSANVRKATIHAIALSTATIPLVLSRLRDIAPQVRRATLEVLAQKRILPSKLGTELVIEILRNGLQDRDKAVRDTCRNKLLLDFWILDAYEGNIFEFIGLLGCTENEKEVLNTLKEIFESQQFEHLLDTVGIDVNHLNPDDVLILRALCEAKRGDGITKYIPTTLIYAEMLPYYSISTFASKHLLELSKSVDMSDEGARKALQQIICSKFLPNPQVENDIIPSAIKALRRIVEDENKLAHLLVDIIRDIKTDAEDAPENSDENENENTETSQDAGKRKDDWATSRTLIICREAILQAPQGNSVSTPFMSVYNSMLKITLGAMSEVEELRRMSLECLALYSMLDKSGAEARNYAPLFLTACTQDVESIQELALKALTDMLTLFDFSVRNKSDVDSNRRASSTTQMSSALQISSSPTENESDPEVVDGFSIQECLKTLKDIAENDNEMKRRLAVQGLIRLMYVGRLVATPDLAFMLLVIYFDPATEDDAELQQWLSVFFPSYASEIPSFKLALEDAFKRTIERFLNAAHDKSVSESHVIRVAQFIIALTSTSLAEETSKPSTVDVSRPIVLIHERLAETVLNEFIGACHEENFTDARVYAKILPSFRFTKTASNDDNLDILRKLSKTAVADCRDKRMRAAISKFGERIEQALDADDEGVSEDEIG